MTTPSGYLTFGIALGLFTARVGLGVASYVKSRKSMSKRLTVSKPPRLKS
jgi:hypothetical protein